MITDAIVIASLTTENPQFASIAPGRRKPLIPIDGRPAVSYLAENLRGCARVGRMIVVGDADVGADVFVTGGETEAEGVLAGLNASDAEQCLIMTGDMPLGSSEALTDLLENAPQTDVVYPVVTREDMEAAFPDRECAYVRAVEGEFTGSSCLLVRRETALEREAQLVRLLGARRNPAALLGIVGPWVALRLAMSTLSITEFEGVLSGGLGVDCRAYVTQHAGLLFSIDSPEDVRLASTLLRHESSRHG